ncbi:MAG: STAS domain-containing protein [Spirochaetes bacterium]|nr:STAS domain-containing protein [Spirochaetota bacterium]
MEFSSQVVENTLIITLKGDISALGGLDLDKRIIKEINLHNPKRLIINMKEVEFLDSQGMGALIIIRQYTLKNKILFSLVGINERLRTIFEHSEMISFFNIRDSEENLI